MAPTLAALRSQAREADALHERSRRMRVDAVRAGWRAGLTQREIADAVGRSQPEVSRLLRFHSSTRIGRALSRKRSDVRRLVVEHGIGNVRVFGSVARGSDTAASDIDLLVDVPSGISLFALSPLEIALEELLGVGVDVVPAHSLPPHLAERVLNEAIPL